MNRFTPGQRVFARPSNPSVKVQRAEGTYGQFLPDAGQEVLLDDFLLRRAQEGAVMLTEIKIQPDHEEP